MGGGTNSAQNAAEARDRETEARIRQNTQSVNRIYDSPERQAQIVDFTNAVRTQYRDELDRQQGDNTRQLKFALARTGQTGSSLAVDTNRDAGKAYQRGAIKVEQGAQGEAAGLRAADEQSRNQLLSLVQAGGDIGTLNANAASSLRNNLLAGQAGATSDALGNAFDKFGDIFSRSKQQSEYRRGLGDYQTLYQPTFGYGKGG